MDERSDRSSALAERLFRDAAGALELYTVYLGERLGLYRALAEGGPATSAELAERTGTTERYVREWLEHHASSGILDVDDPAAAPLERRYRLPAAHVPVLTDPDDLRYEAYRGVEIVRAARPLPDLVDAFRTGGAPPPLAWEPEGRGEPNRALFLNLLGTQWLPAIPEVDRRLRADPPARVADAGCGAGWSSIGMAIAYPAISVDGFDLDAEVIVAARRHAEESGVADRVRFSVGDASDPGLAGRFDLVTIFEALHDMPRPVQALRWAHAMLADQGSVLVAEELVGDEFAAPGPETERYHYGWSVAACLQPAMGAPKRSPTGALAGHLHQQPALAPAPADTGERVRTGELGSLELEPQVAVLGGLLDRDLLAVPLCEVAPGARVPDQHRARPVLALGDHALEVGVVHRMVLGGHRQTLVPGVGGRPLGDSPGLEDAVGLQPEVVVQRAGVVLLDHEDRLPAPAAPGARRAGRLRCAPRIALCWERAFRIFDLLL